MQIGTDGFWEKALFDGRNSLCEIETGTAVANIEDNSFLNGIPDKRFYFIGYRINYCLSYIAFQQSIRVRINIAGTKMFHIQFFNGKRRGAHTKVNHNG